MNIRFSGSPEVLFNLGNALRAAQFYVSCHPQAPAGTHIQHQTKLDVFLESATVDSSFPDVIDTFPRHADTPLGPAFSASEGMDTFTLGDVVNDTDYFGDGHERIRVDGFKLFAESLTRIAHNMAKRLGRSAPTLQRFLTQLEPEDNPLIFRLLGS